LKNTKKNNLNYKKFNLIKIFFKYKINKLEIDDEFVGDDFKNLEVLNLGVKELTVFF
jgi:hypothetical protein